MESATPARPFGHPSVPLKYCLRKEAAKRNAPMHLLCFVGMQPTPKVNVKGRKSETNAECIKMCFGMYPNEVPSRV